MAHKDPEKKKASDRKWRLIRREKRKANSRTWRAAHSEHQRTYRAAYNLAHREERRIAYRNWVATHRNTVRTRQRAAYAANPTRTKTNTKVWRSANPEKVRAIKRRHRAHKANAPINDFTAAQWREMQEHYGHRCVYCGKRAKGHLTQDHLTPLSKGGSHTLSNIVPACRACNSKKNAGPILVPVQPLLL